MRRLIELAESQNVALAQSFANTIWPRFSGYVTSASNLDRDVLRTRPETHEIHEAVKTVSAGLPTLKVKLYSLQGVTVYSSEPAEIGEDKSSNVGFFFAARSGKPASKLTFRDSLSSFEGTVQDRDLVESYLPIRQGDGPVEGVFELYSDVTPLLSGIRRSTINLVVGFVLVFGMLHGTLFLIVRRADRTIRQQYADIAEKNAALRHQVNERKHAEEALKKAHHELERRVEERTRELTEEIIERKRAEDAARRHQNELARVGAVIILGEMATTLAHELNQPLAVISGCAQVCLTRLRSDGARPEEILDYLEQMADQAERANEIIRRVRGFIHKEAQENRRIDVNEAIHGIADLLRSDAREHGAAITLNLGDPLPLVMADPVQIQQVVLNLAHNGMEAMRQVGPAQRHLTIGTSASGDGVIEVAVHDNGQGIPAEDLDRVFNPFFTTKTGGLGMGLSISRSIIEAHGGRLWATSEGETGTVFRFTLPAAEESRRDDA
ncbi:MAG: sensor histidine kinase [Kiloniellales bacterium]